MSLGSAHVPDADRSLQELAAAEQRNRALLDAIPDNMFRISLDGTYVDFHSNQPGSLTLPPEQIVGANVADHMPQADATLRLEAIKRVVESGQGESFEIQVVSRTGEVVDHEVRMEKSGEREVLAITRDITERKRAERILVQQREELRRSRARIVEAEASERRRLERNLHDGAQARLVALSLALKLAQSQLTTNPEAAALLTDASSELALALRELRDLARGLHPAMLADRGLEPALDALAERSPLPVTMRIRPDGRLPEPVEVAVYYIVAEALTNVAKYAQASHATVEVLRRDEEVEVEIVDDGIGGADPSRGSGLRGLADRVEVLNGRLSVESTPGSGTRIRAQIPLPADLDQPAITDVAGDLPA